MGEKSPSEGGGNSAARSERLRKEREAAEARRRAEAKQPMRQDDRSERQQRAAADVRASKMPGGYGSLTASKASMGARSSSIEELQARADDTRNPISKINLENQIKQLKAGGTPVTTKKASGEVLTVGVVRDGTFSGRQGFSPSTGATKLNRATGAYEAVYGAAGRSSGSGGDSRATAPATTPSAPTVTPISQAPSMGEDAARRAMMSTAAAGRKRRKLLG